MIRIFILLASLTAAALPAIAEDTPVQSEPLVNAPITGVATHNLLMTRVHIAANTILPMHYHPTEEFLYILEGTALLRIKGREDRLLTAGMAAVIPAGEVHTAVTLESEAVALTTRVHPKGQPVRLSPPEEKE